MGILFKVQLDVAGSVYKCIMCKTHLAEAGALDTGQGDTYLGPVHTFSKMVNLKLDPQTIFVQIFKGDDSFLLDTDPLMNSGVSEARELSCMTCNFHLGWKLLDPDRLLCLKSSIF